MEAKTRTLSLAHSPDSDDAFMFWALAEGRVGADGIEFQHTLSDIQSLNRAALEGRYDVTAISVHAYPYVAGEYAFLNVGASLGSGYGPVLIAREPLSLQDLGDRVVAIPGALTTAALVLRLAAPTVRTKEMPFDAILEAVGRGDAAAGLIIHEGQMTYRQQNLELVADLGQWWLDETGLPLPLGANVIRRELGEGVIGAVASLIRESIDHGLRHRSEAVKYAKVFGRNLAQNQVDRFVSMYVNNFTLDLGETGRKAVVELLERGASRGIVPQLGEIQFVG
jgi:1,4-dihydroxy-6-naphthoate synthase